MRTSQDQLRKAPLREVPICAKLLSVLGVGFDRKLKLSADPENEAVDRAGAKDARKAALSVGGTCSPLPRGRLSPVASQVMSRSTVAGTARGPPNWKPSITETPWALRFALRESWLTRSAFSGSWTAQNRPDGWTPPRKSCSCEPEPGSKRSTQTKTNSPLSWREPSLAT